MYTWHRTVWPWPKEKDSAWSCVTWVKKRTFLTFARWSVEFGVKLSRRFDLNLQTRNCSDVELTSKPHLLLRHRLNCVAYPAVHRLVPATLVKRVLAVMHRDVAHPTEICKSYETRTLLRVSLELLLTPRYYLLVTSTAQRFVRYQYSLLLFPH